MTRLHKNAVWLYLCIMVAVVHASSTVCLSASKACIQGMHGGAEWSGLHGLAPHASTEGVMLTMRHENLQ